VVVAAGDRGDTEEEDVVEVVKVIPGPGMMETLAQRVVVVEQVVPGDRAQAQSSFVQKKSSSTGISGPGDCRVRQGTMGMRGIILIQVLTQVTGDRGQLFVAVEVAAVAPDHRVVTAEREAAAVRLALYGC